MGKKDIHHEVVELTKELIRFPSTQSRPDAVNDCASFISSWLDRYDIQHICHTSNNIPSIYALPKPDFASVLLLTHFDVVESEDTAIFSPYEKNDRLFGRGAIDDKYGVALSLILLREHVRKARSNGLDQVDIPFGILLTGDEENGGIHSARQLAHTISTDFFLAIDGGNPGLIVTKEKGLILLQLKATGKSAHAARPWLGRSGFDLLIEDYNRMQSLFTETREDHWHRTMVLTKCKVGNGATNILPEQAEAIFDIRYTDFDDADKLIASIQAKTCSEVVVRAKESVFKSGQSPLLDLLVAKSGGARVGFEHGASDARYFSSLGVPGAIWGADGEMSQHSENEHIVLSSLYQLYDRIDSFLTHLPNT